MLPVTRFGNGICIQSARAVKYVKQIHSKFSSKPFITHRRNALQKAPTDNSVN